MSSKRFSIPILLKGMAMGVAEAIPGVSGGTIAFITGIYERLIHSIKSFDHRLMRLLYKRQWKEAFGRVQGLFLINLLLGMVIGLVAAIFGITALLESHPTVVWGFFFGLIASSVVWIILGLSGLGWQNWIWMPLGIMTALWIVNATPAGGSEAWWYVLVCGTLAICALIMPGISGSFILLLLGMYTYILETVKLALQTLDNGAIATILLFATGCLVGLLLFARVLDWAFTHHRKNVLLLLCGFMTGSLWRIWPWRNVIKWRAEDGQVYSELPEPIGNDWLHEVQILQESNVLPDRYLMGDPYTIMTLIAVAAGLALIWFFPRPPISTAEENDR